MPERKNQRKVPSESIQGEGSFVIVTPLTYGEQREIALSPLDSESDSEARAQRDEAHVRAHVVGWNWVDDAGAPLPLPTQDDGVLERLTVEEWNFVVGAINGDPNALSG